MVKLMVCFEDFCVIRIILIFVCVKELNNFVVIFGILNKLLFDKVNKVILLIDEIFLMVVFCGFGFLEIRVFEKFGLNVFLMYNGIFFFNVGCRVGG